MTSDFELALFEEEWRDVRSLPEASRWELERDDSVPLGIFVVMHPKSNPAERYKARLCWSNYFGAVSLKFVSLQNNESAAPTDWPQCGGFRPSSMDACVSWTAEGHALHPEWANSTKNAFPKLELPMHFALLKLQFELDNTYTGRGHR